MATDSETSSAHLVRGIATLYQDTISPATLKASLHLVANLFAGTASFVVVTFLLALAVGLFFLFPLAIVVQWFLVATVRTLASLERRRVRALLGTAIATPPRPSDDGLEGRLRTWFADGPTWRAVLYFVALLPLGLLTSTLTLFVWSFPVTLVIASLAGAVGPSAADPTQWALRVTTGLLGLALLGLVPFPTRILGDLSARVARMLLGPPRRRRPQRGRTGWRRAGRTSWRARRRSGGGSSGTFTMGRSSASWRSR